MHSFFDTAMTVLDSGPGVDIDPKIIGETSLVARVLTRLGVLDPEEQELLAVRIVDLIHGDSYLRLGHGTLRPARVLLPYAALRPQDRNSKYFEGLRASAQKSPLLLSEALPYEHAEAQYSMALLGDSPLPTLGSASWYNDMTQVFAFGQFEGYVLTHRHFFANDFGLDPKPCFSGQAALLVTLCNAEAWGNVDLLLECVVCLLDEQLCTAEFGLIAAATRVAIRQLEQVSKAGHSDTYHEIFVLALVMAKMQRLGVAVHERTDVSFDSVREFAAALRGKDPRAVGATLKASSSLAPHLAGPFTDMAIAKLKFLLDGTASEILFFEELARLSETGHFDYGSHADLITRHLEKLTQCRETRPLSADESRQTTLHAHASRSDKPSA